MAHESSQSANVGAYLRTKVLTASPEELRLMLLDGAVRFARQGRDGLAARDYEASFSGFAKCRNILLELINSMRPEIDPDLCRRVSSLYTFMYSELVAAGVERDAAKADHVIELLEYERQTWAMLMEKLAEERAAAAMVRAAHAAPAAPGQDPAETRAYASLSVQG